MMRKQRTDRPALNFADSSIQGRSADSDAAEDEIVIDGPPPPRRVRNKALPKWMTTGASSSDDKGQGDDSSGDSFVVLPRSTRSRKKRGTGDQKDDHDWLVHKDNDVFLLDNDDEHDSEEIQEDDDDDFEPSTSRIVKKPVQNQRLQMQIKREQQRILHKKQQEEEMHRLQQEEDADFDRALELSRMEMEEQARIRQKEDEFLANISKGVKEDIDSDDDDIGPRSGSVDIPNCHSKRRHGVGYGDNGATSSVTEDSEPENIGNILSSKRLAKRPMSKMAVVRPEPSATNSRQRSHEPDQDDSSQDRNSQSPSLFCTTAGSEERHSQQNNNEMPSSTSGASTSRMNDVKQETPTVRATRLSLRKRPLEDANETVTQPRKLMRGVVPQPPDISTLDDLVSDSDVKEENVVETKRKVSNGAKSQGGSHGGGKQKCMEVWDDVEGEEEDPPFDEGVPLVDTRNQPDKPSMYVPEGVCYKAYTTVILKLLRHYCLRLRRAQAKSALRVKWSSPVVPGPLFSGTLLHRKRGMKAPVPLYSLSDDDDDPLYHASDGEWKTAVKHTEKTAVKDSGGTRKRKRKVVISDSDSDELVDFDIDCLAKKTLRKTNLKERKQEESQNEDSDIGVLNVNENVPLVKFECVARINGSNQIFDDVDIPGGSSRVNSIDGSSNAAFNDTGVSGGINGGDASQTLPYDEYNADTEEYNNHFNEPPVSDTNEATTSVQPQDNSRNEVEKVPSTSSASAVESVSESVSNVKVKSDINLEVHASEAQENVGNGTVNVTAQSDKLHEDLCLVDSTTISVLRKSSHAKMNGDSPSPQTSHSSHQGTVSSSEALEIAGGNNTIFGNDRPQDGVRVANSRNYHKKSEVAEAVATSAPTTSSEINAFRTDNDSGATNVETTSGAVKQLKNSSADNVSSMPKAILTEDAKKHCDPEAGVSSSKEAAALNITGLRKFTDVHPGVSFEEMRLRFYECRETLEASEADEPIMTPNSSTANMEANSSTSNKTNNENKVLKAADLDTCARSHDTVSKSEHVSSSLSVRTKLLRHGSDKTRQRTTMQKQTTDVASTSDNSEVEAAESSKGNSSPEAMINRRHVRHQSPGVASSSDDQGSRPLPKISNRESSESCTSSKVQEENQRVEAVESSGLDSDASGGVIAARPKATVVRTSGIGSSDEATTSEENAKSMSKGHNRNGEEASTSADSQPVNKAPAKGREALAAPKQEASIAKVTNTSQAKGREAQAAPKQEASIARVTNTSQAKGREAQAAPKQEASIARVTNTSQAKGREAQAAPKQEASIARVTKTSQAATNDTLPDQPIGEDIVERLDDVSSNKIDIEGNAAICVECPLCGIEFPLRQIETHASGCDGPPEPLQEQVAVMPRSTMQQQKVRPDVEIREEEDAVSDDVEEAPHSEELSFPNSSLKAGWRDRKEVSRKKPVHTYSRIRNTTAGTTDDSDEWPSAEEDMRRSSRTRATRTKLAVEDDEEEGNSTPELDHVEETIYQMAENNQIQLVEPRPHLRAGRAGHGGSNKQARSPPTTDEEEKEKFEKCFLCNKLIPMSKYAAHVNEEVDRMQNNESSSEGTATGEALPAETGLVRRMRRTDTSTAAKIQQNTDNDTNREFTGESSEDDEDSPIRAYKKISEQPANLIDFKNQFKTSTPGVSSFNGKGPGKGKAFRGRGKAYRGKRGRGKRRK